MIDIERISRKIISFKFDTEEEYKNYMKQHPDADKSKHTVVEQEKDNKKEDNKKKQEIIELPEEDIIKESVKDAVKEVFNKKKTYNEKSLSKVNNILKSNELKDEEETLNSLSDFKKTLGQRVPEKDIGKYYVRNEKKLKADFLKNMDRSKYDSKEAFEAAKKKIQDMPVGDFGKILAAIDPEDEESV